MRRRDFIIRSWRCCESRNALMIDVTPYLRATREARAKCSTQSPDEIIHDPQRWKLTDYLYSLSDEARGDLIVLMLVGRGDVEHAAERAAEICLKYTSADDQVAYLMSKTVRLAEYLKIGMHGI
jgi:Protein of unknown function (DUF3775)